MVRSVGGVVGGDGAVGLEPGADFLKGHRLRPERRSRSQCQGHAYQHRHGHLAQPLNLVAWDFKQLRAISDFDATHQINANWIWQLPFGRGRAWGKGAHGLTQALIGGWQLSGLFRITSGFPVSIFDGYELPTNWQEGGQATSLGHLPAIKRNKEGNGTVNMFANPQAAINDFMFTLPGASGIRNPVRGDGTIRLDTGLAKRWTMPWSEHHSLQFRWEVFNLSNWNRFDVQSNPPEIDISSTFGNYTGLLTSPRVMQFALRYEF
jgi:hypothetical protein